MSQSKLQTSEAFIHATRRFIAFYDRIDELEKTNLVQTFKDDIDHALNTYLVRHPEMFKKHESKKHGKRKTRRCILHKFREIFIVYHYDKKTDTVLLLDLSHYKQKR